ncbi:hypothetical protein D918_07616 [Trichuris suis]|nr:hypothetical protein D918_07616 [Trichuris suis]
MYSMVAIPISLCVDKNRPHPNFGEFDANQFAEHPCMYSLFNETTIYKSRLKLPVNSREVLTRQHVT